MDYQLEQMAEQQTIYVASTTSKDSAGQPIYGAPASRHAIVGPPKKRRTVTLSNGEEKQVAWEVVCATAILITDKVWLPGADSTVAAEGRRPLAVNDGPPEYLGTTPQFYTAAF